MITSYNQLPVGLWLDIQALQESATPYDEIDLRVKILAILTGMTERDILNAPIADVTEWSRGLAFLERPAPEVGRIAAAYRAGAFTLIPTTDLRKITTAQYIDFQAFAPEGDKKLVELLSVFLVPEGCKYNDGYDVGAVQDAIRADLSVADVLALTAFFLTRYAALMRHSRSSLARILRKEKDPGRKIRIQARVRELDKLTETLLTPLRTAGGGSQKSTT